MHALRATLISIVALGGVMTCPVAAAWGDHGHKVIALIADGYLEPAVRQKVNAMLAGDTSGLTPSKGIADQATWADRFRDSDRNSTRVRYELTREWHFVDIEIDGPDLDKACFGHPTPLPNASQGPTKSCVVDRIAAFAAELRDSTKSADERRLALQFLLHFVGDVHQPLHASDDGDNGGNTKNVKASGLSAASLHSYWDTQFVRRLGNDPRKIARTLRQTTTAAQFNDWSSGDARFWAMQSYELAKLRVYGPLGNPDSAGIYNLSASYVTNATNATARQLVRAGIRLAKVLNDALR